MSPPAVSFLMPVRDSEATVAEAIESVLRQSCGDLELIAVDDCSSDGTPGILRHFVRSDSRMAVIRGPGRGVAAALNAGLDRCRAAWVVRMDADDVCLGDRLKRQLGAAESRPEVGVWGAWAERFGVNAKPRQWRPPVEPEVIRLAAVVGAPLIHPTTMLRSDVLRSAGGWPEVKAEDHALWTRLMNRGVVLRNLPRIVLRYRCHPNNVSKSPGLLESAALVGREHARSSFGVDFTFDRFDCFRALLHAHRDPQPNDAAVFEMEAIELMEAAVRGCSRGLTKLLRALVARWFQSAARRLGEFDAVGASRLERHAFRLAASAGVAGCSVIEDLLRTRVRRGIRAYFAHF